MTQDDEKMTVCPNCGAALGQCGSINPDRAGGTSSSDASGNPPAELFLEPFQDPDTPPAVLGIPNLVERLEDCGLKGDPESIRFLLSRMNYRTVRKYCRAIEQRASKNYLIVENVQTLVSFDRTLQSIMLQGISEVELHFRAELSKAMATHLGAFAHHHAENFKNKKHYEVFLADYTREVSYKLAGRKSINPEDFATYGDVPVWQAIEIMSLGALSKLYRNVIDKRVRHEVADSFGVKFDRLVSWMRTICEIRNRCAHFEDVCVTPLTCKPMRIPDVTAKNDGAFYACLVIDRLISCGESYEVPQFEYKHIMGFANSLAHLTEQVPDPVFLAAGFPMNWLKQLKISSTHINHIYRTRRDKSGNRIRTQV